MSRSFLRIVAPALLVGFSSAACRSANRASPDVAPGRVDQVALSAAAKSKAENIRRPNNAADVHFMSGMIPHHAQAVLIAGWAPSHGARADVRALCERIVVGQRDEIALMQNWLRDHSEKVPEATATRMKMTMGGVEHDMLMPGMLTDEELGLLDKARGSEFDRMFLSSMVRHHEGALTMVNELFGSYGAGQDEIVFRFASDVYADQTTEIERMNKMLATIP